jgi:hypothetical protein
MEKAYVVTRTWFVTAENSIEAIMKTKNWDHQSVHAVSPEDAPNINAYCVKCRAKREMKEVMHISLKNGKPARMGKCVKCDTRMFRIGSGK